MNRSLLRACCFHRTVDFQLPWQLQYRHSILYAFDRITLISTHKLFKTVCKTSDTFREFPIFIQFIHSYPNANPTSRLKNCVKNYTVAKLSLVANNGCCLAFKACGFWQSSRPVDYLNHLALP